MKAKEETMGLRDERKSANGFYPVWTYVNRLIVTNKENGLLDLPGWNGIERGSRRRPTKAARVSHSDEPINRSEREK